MVSIKSQRKAVEATESNDESHRNRPRAPAAAGLAIGDPRPSDPPWGPLPDDAARHARCVTALTAFSWALREGYGSLSTPVARSTLLAACARLLRVCRDHPEVQRLHRVEQPTSESPLRSMHSTPASGSDGLAIVAPVSPRRSDGSVVRLSVSRVLTLPGPLADRLRANEETRRVR